MNAQLKISLSSAVSGSGLLVFADSLHLTYEAAAELYLWLGGALPLCRTGIIAPSQTYVVNEEGCELPIDGREDLNSSQVSEIVGQLDQCQLAIHQPRAGW